MLILYIKKCRNFIKSYWQLKKQYGKLHLCRSNICSCIIMLKALSASYCKHEHKEKSIPARSVHYQLQYNTPRILSVSSQYKSAKPVTCIFSIIYLFDNDLRKTVGNMKDNASSEVFILLKAAKILRK